MVLPLMVAMAVFLLPADPAFASAPGSLGCSSGSPSGGSLIGTNCNTDMSIDKIFSGLICNYKKIIDDVLKALFCAVAYVFKDVVGACLSLAVVIYGIKMTLGAAQIRESVLVLVKIGFVSTMALNASSAIGIGFNFFYSLMENGVMWVVSSVIPVSSTDGLFSAVDSIFNNLLTSPTSNDGMKLLGFIALLGQVLAPLFTMTIYFFVKSLLIFIRSILTYLLSLSAIAFLFAISPMFFCFLLFRSTYTFFDSWLKHLASFVLQVILTFAAMAMWIKLMSYLGDFFVQLSDAIIVYNAVWNNNGQLDPTSTWGLCPNYSVGNGPYGPTLSCGGGGEEPIVPTALVAENDFMYFFVVNIVTLLLAAYAFDTVIRQIPEIAKQLSGPQAIPAIGRGFPGFEQMEQRFEGAISNRLASDTKRSADNVKDMVSKGINSAIDPKAKGQSYSQMYKDLQSGLVKNR